MHRVRPFIIIIIIMSFLLLCVFDSANDAKKWPTLDDSTNTHIHSSKQIVYIFLFLLVRKTSLLSTPLFWCVLCPNAITFAFYHLCIAFNLFVLLCNQIYSWKISQHFCIRRNMHNEKAKYTKYMPNYRKCFTEREHSTTLKPWTKVFKYFQQSFP